MNIILICILAAIAVITLSMVIHYNVSIKRGRCPICGAPIRHFANGKVTGLRCTECDWVRITDEYGNKY